MFEKILFNKVFSNRYSMEKAYSEYYAKTVKEMKQNAIKNQSQEIDKELIKQIDYEDSTFINRLSETLDVSGLIESIKVAGLLHPIFLQIKGSSSYKVVTGYRRALALRELFETGFEFGDKINKPIAIILDEDAPLDLLNRISFDENTVRENLTILEQANHFFKIMQAYNSKDANILIQEEYNISKQYKNKILKVLDFNETLKEFLEELGLSKAEKMQQIIDQHDNISEDEIVDLIEENLDKTREELEDIIQSLKNNKPKAYKVNFSFQRELKENEKKVLEYINELIHTNNSEQIIKILQLVPNGESQHV